MVYVDCLVMLLTTTLPEAADEVSPGPAIKQEQLAFASQVTVVDPPERTRSGVAEMETEAASQPTYTEHKAVCPAAVTDIWLVPVPVKLQASVASAPSSHVAPVPCGFQL